MSPPRRFDPALKTTAGLPCRCARASPRGKPRHCNDQILSAVKHGLFDRFGIDHTPIQIESESYAHLGEVH